MVLYRIFTENKNYNDIIAQLMLRGIDYSIIYECNGIWEGKAENSVCIEIVPFGIIRERINQFIEWIKEHNNQDKVLLQTIQLDDIKLI